MARLHPSNVKEVASNKPASSATAFNLPDSATAPYRSFDSALATGDTVPVHATNGTAWQDFIGTFTAGTPDTLAQTTLLDSSTGAFIDWSAGGDVTLEISWPGKLGEFVDARVLPDYISGLVVSWSTATQIKVSAGNAYVQKAGYVVNLASEATINPTLSASTWHYVYLKDDGTCEVSTTAPAAAYAGSARSKNTSGSEFRWIGQFRTDASSNIYRFRFSPDTNSWAYPLAADSAIYRVLSNGQAITSTAVSLAAFVPPQSTSAYIKASNTDTTDTCVIADGDTTAVGNATGYFTIAPAVRASLECPLNASQQLNYDFDAAPTGGAYIDVMAYYCKR